MKGKGKGYFLVIKLSFFIVNAHTPTNTSRAYLFAVKNMVCRTSEKPRAASASWR
jgi:hypothetical protein